MAILTDSADVVMNKNVLTCATKKQILVGNEDLLAIDCALNVVQSFDELSFFVFVANSVHAENRRQVCAPVAWSQQLYRLSRLLEYV